MSLRHQLSDLPLILADIPLPAADWLRQAGVPVCNWHANRTSDAAESDLPATITNNECLAGSTATPPPGRFVLFDSRRPVHQLTSQLCRRWGLTRIDVARLMYDVPAGRVADPYRQVSSKGRSAGNPARSMFLSRLKTTIEQNGGVWGRLSDFPHPYHSLICLNGRVDGSPGDGQRTLSARLDAGVVEQAYQSGRPLALPKQSPERSAATAKALSQRYPYLWQTTLEEFRQWWQQRRQVTLSMRQNETAYHWDARQVPVETPAVLELWRGSHVAWLPLSNGSMQADLAGIVFQKQSHRHPAGFTACWPDGFGDIAPADWQAARRRPAG